MRLHRFITPFDFNQKTLIISDAEIVSQWRTVLRLKPGDQVILSDGQGHEAETTILNLDKKEAQVSIDTVLTPKREPEKNTTLFCALLKRENFELVVQKATEIGISRIVPLLTERTIKMGFNRERLEKILLEACEQSGRTTIPKLTDPIKFEEAIASVASSESILFDLTGESTGFPFQATNAFIGPEGGFSEKEVGLARTNGIKIGLLGSLTFRGETAAIVVSYLLTQ